MLDAQIDLSGPEPEPSAAEPNSCGARIELEGAVDQSDCRIDIALEVADRERRLTENLGVIAGSTTRTTGKVDTLLEFLLRVLRPAVQI